MARSSALSFRSSAFSAQRGILGSQCSVIGLQNLQSRCQIVQAFKQPQDQRVFPSTVNQAAESSIG
jgi:hypothetical protein